MSNITFEEIHNDTDFYKLFENANVVKAHGEYQAPPEVQQACPRADVYFELSNGTWLAMHVNVDSNTGCETCGYGGDEKRYWKSV